MKLQKILLITLARLCVLLDPAARLMDGAEIL